MMLKTNQPRNRRMRVLALAPAAAIALLVTNIPLVAHGLSAVGQSDMLPASATEGKVTQKSHQSHAAPSDSAANEVIMITGTGSPDRNAKYFVTVDGEEFEGDLNSIPSDRVASMDVIKTDNGSTINIVLKKPGESNPAAAAQTMPKFPGGETEMLKWLKQNVEYPADVKPSEMPDKVKVIVKFTVNQDGEAVNPEIVRGGSASYNAEALKVIGKMPKWIPGTVKGKPVSVYYTLPIVFKKPVEDKK